MDLGFAGSELAELERANAGYSSQTLRLGSREIDTETLDPLFLPGYSLNLLGGLSRGEADTVFVHALGQGDSAIRYFSVLCLAFVLAPSSVHADLMTYTLTGTVQDVVGYSDMYGAVNPGASLPVAKGDRLIWTVQYDASTPVANLPNVSAALVPGVTLQGSSYLPSGPLITHIVDQTNGFHVYTSRSGSFPANGLPPGMSPYSSSLVGLSNWQKYGTSDTGSVTFLDYQPSTRSRMLPYFASLTLYVGQLLPTLNLAKLQLDHVPFRFKDPATSPALQFSYKGPVSNTQTYFSFDAHVDSISAAGSIASLPEPGALTLFALGAASLAARRFRQALHCVR